MATYPNLPGGYMYDLGRDGTLNTLKAKNTGALLKTLTTGDMDELANWYLNYNQNADANGPVALISQFPQPRTVTGMTASGYNSGYTTSIGYVQHSIDTTDGIDGSWTTFGQYDLASAEDTPAQVRAERIWNAGVSNITAVRFVISDDDDCRFQNYAVWGTTVLEGLVPWHATLDQALSNDTGDLDRGDILVTAPPVTQQFRIKNTSLTSTAQDVVIAADANSTLSFGALANEVLFSTDNVNFQQSITLPSVAADSISGIVYMKRPTPTDIAGTIRLSTIRASATSWT